MKNKLIILIIYLLFQNNLAIAQSFKFETENLDITNKGNQINAGKGKAFSLDNNLEIQANKFEYTKDLDILKSSGNGLVFIRSKNLNIEFDNAFFDQKNSILRANGNIKIKQTDKDLIIVTDKIIYDQKNSQINSDTQTTLTDNLKNEYIVDNFLYEIDKSLIKVINLRFKDIENNNLKTPLAYINTDTNKLFGKDVDINLNNSSFNKENEPRLKGNSVIYDNKNTEITKGVFTTCKKRDGCPPWQMSAEKIQHDKKKQTIYYENALLHVYDLPVMYFPKFFHPDPSVKRRSGFLIPTIKNSPSSDNYLNIPYFLAIAENKDATFYPRFYTEDKILLQTEYRQINSKSNHITDFSLFAQKGKNSKSHFFYEYGKILDFTNFENSQVDLIVQKTSNDTYLKTNKLTSEIETDNNILENSIGLNLYSNDLSIDFDTTIYEDLNKDDSDRFEYILPKINLVKKINNNTPLNGNFSFKSQALIRNYNTNIYEKTNINDLIFSSYPKITKGGYYNNYEFLIKNSNTDSQNSSNYKKNENFYASGIFQYNSSLPLIKENESSQKILKPRLSLKLAPTHTKDQRKENSRIDANSVYSLSRVTDNDSIEGGMSIAYGSDYSIYDKINSREVLNLKLASNLRLKENDDLPINNQIGQKTSNLFGEISFNPDEVLTTTYKTSLKNNLSETSYQNLITEFQINNFVTTFDYLNENNTSDQNSYLTNKTTYFADKFNSFSFSTRENKTANLTEYYNLMYQYKNDCLAASIEYNKDYYTDRDLKPDESIFFKLTIIPFGETSSPNLKN